MNDILITVSIALVVLSGGGCDGAAHDDDQTVPDDDDAADDDDSSAGDDDDAADDDDSSAGDDDDAADDDDSSADDDDTTPVVVALYDDTSHADAGAWGVGLDALEQTLLEDGITVQRVTREQLNDVVGVLSGFDVVLFGGGFAFPGYTLRIDAGGKVRLQEFVHGGGAYVGICAGAYAACSDLMYDGDHWDTESGYDLDLYSGTCYGQVHDIATYPSWGLAHLEFPGHAATDAHAAGPFDLDLWYGGGPYFDQAPAGTEILATYDDPAVAQDGLPAVIAQPYGDGVVVLWGPHPELDDPGASSGNRDVFTEVLRWTVR